MSIWECLLVRDPRPREALKEREGDLGAFSTDGVLLDLRPVTASFEGAFARVVCNGVALVTLAAVLSSRWRWPSLVNCVPLLTGKGGASSLAGTTGASRRVFRLALLYLLDL